MTGLWRRALVVLAVTLGLLLANSLAFTRSLERLSAKLDGAHFLIVGAQQILVIGGLLFLLVGIASGRGRVFRIWVGVLCVVTAVVVYYINNYGIRLHWGILDNIVAAKSDEFGDFIDLKLGAYLLAGLGGGILFYHLPHLPLLRDWPALRGWPWDPLNDRIGRLSKRDWLKIAGAALVAFTLVRVPVLFDYKHYRSFIKDDIGDYAPLNLIAASADFGRRKFEAQNVPIEDITGQFSRRPAAGGAPLTIVIVVGESSRGDRFALNGYDRDTNPALSVEPGLRYFSDASACDTSTVPAVSCMFSRFTRREFRLPLRETSLVGILKSQGFRTYWHSLQRNSVPVGITCGEADVCEDNLKGRYDEALLGSLDRTLAASKDSDTLIVLHTRGSHTGYHERVPPNEVFFRPFCDKSPFACDKAELDNAYDNTIRYIDRFLKSVIDRLSRRNAFLIYASDHGESLGELGITGAAYGHATPVAIAPAAQTHIPMLFWTSPAFRGVAAGALGGQGGAMAEVIARPVSHDNIFHSVLDCAGVASPLVRTELSFCR